MSAFKSPLQYFAPGSDTSSCQDYEEYEFVECLSRKQKLSTYLNTVSYNHISFLNTHLQLVWDLASSGFFSISRNMISRSAGYTIPFRKQPPFRGKAFVPCRCDIFRFFDFMLLGNSSRAPVFSYNQINNLKTFTLTVESISAISFSTRWPRCFNKVTLPLNEIELKTPSSFEIILVS